MGAADSIAVRSKARADGFESFMQGHRARLVQALTMISLDREAAADAAQEAFIQLYPALGQRRTSTATRSRGCTGWASIAARTIADSCRAPPGWSSVWARRRTGRPEEGELVEWTPDPDFASVFRSLPKRQRTAATLYYLNDLSVGEIARIMNISEGAVNSHLHRAREALKGLVEAG